METSHGSGCLTAIATQINKASIMLTADFVVQKEDVTHPLYYRAGVRCLVSLIVMATLVAAVVFVAHSQANFLVIRREYTSESPPFINSAPPPGPLNISFDQNDATVCPCLSQSLSWGNFVDVSLIHPDSPTTTLLVQVPLLDIDNNQLCNTSVSNFICTHVLGGILPGNSSIWVRQDTSIETPNLLSPTALYINVLAQINANMASMENSYVLLSLSNETLYYYASFLIDMIVATSYQLQNNTASTKEDFWNKTEYLFQKVVFPNTTLDFSIQYALGISINWEKYAASCSPKYCDIVQPYPTHTKVLHAIAEVGGFLTITLFIVRGLLWPAIIKVFCFHVRK